MPKENASVELVQDSEDEQQPKKSPEKKVVSPEAESVPGSEAKQGEGQADEDEEEYEIEAILDAKHGMFAGGRMGYLVKWKGYEEEHNSWVDEKDAGNAQVVLDAYWEKQKKQKKAKPRQSKSASRPRKSATRDGDGSPVLDDTPSSQNKRKKSISGRKSKSDQPEEDAVADEEEERPVTKKLKQAPRVKKNDEMDVDEDVGEHDYMPMKKYRYHKSWEVLVKKVDTIEKIDGTLKVFFTLNNGDRVVETSQECAKHFPQKLIQFYESNLRWRESE